MGSLEGRVAVITGAGRGIGRQHALLFAAEGARVIVNDLGGAVASDAGGDSDAAAAVVAEIIDAGGEAVANTDDCADWNGGRRLIAAALDAFGRLDILVNNAGILRDRALVNMVEDEWDEVVRVHLKGHFVPTRWAAEHWRSEHKAGRPQTASVIHTSSTSGLVGNPGQTNYGAAKAGIAAFAAICAQELSRYGVRSNCVCPSARTRLSETAPGIGAMIAAPVDDRFDVWDPANVSPLVAYLAMADCPFNGTTFYAQGGAVKLVHPWTFGEGVERDGRWTISDLRAALAPFASRSEPLVRST
jgi:NAD(P)-dependent dehydrogenase (short-subunit alcohol dehydrogenase family)